MCLVSAVCNLLHFAMNKFCRFSTGLFFLSVEKLFQVCKGSDPLLRQLTVSCLVDMKPLRQLPLKVLRGSRVHRATEVSVYKSMEAHRK